MLTFGEQVGAVEAGSSFRKGGVVHQQTKYIFEYVLENRIKTINFMNMNINLQTNNENNSQGKKQNNKKNNIIFIVLYIIIIIIFILVSLYIVLSNTNNINISSSRKKWVYEQIEYYKTMNMINNRGDNINNTNERKLSDEEQIAKKYNFLNQNKYDNKTRQKIHGIKERSTAY